MPSIVLKKHAQPIQISDQSLLNTVKPLEYREWLQNNIGVIPEQAESQFQKYLNDWYNFQNTSKNLANQNDKIKSDYIALLKRLQVIFQNDEEFNRISNIDFNNQTELKLAIPYFARKLKEIALYYVSKREDIKKSKLRYNMVGSFNGLERVLYDYLLKSFTKRENIVTVQSKELFNNIPELSSVSSDFIIEVEELYDMNNYFNKSYSQNNNPEGIYDRESPNPLLFVLEDYIANFYNALNTSEVPLSGFGNPLSQFVLCETDAELNIEVQQQITEKYLANNLYYLSGGYYDWDTVTTTKDFAVGNNFFYWFSGANVFDIADGIYQDTPIEKLDWTAAQGASSFEKADIIFVSNGNTQTKGAWLMDSPSITVDDTLSTTIQDNKSFIFPFPGQGKIRADGSWSGKTVSDIAENKILFTNDGDISTIRNFYWNDTNSVSSSNAILLQDTTLIDDGAFASNRFQFADKIIVKKPTEEVDTAYLYAFNQTEIPITKGTNSLYFPLTSYTQPTDLFFRYESADTVLLSAVDVSSSFTGAVAGQVISAADMIFKIDGICGAAVEAAWLQSAAIPNRPDKEHCNCEGNNYVNFYTGWKITDGAIQPGTSFKANEGEYVKFVWTSPDTALNDLAAFTGFDHDDACEYKKLSKHHSLLDNNFLNQASIYEEWKTCTCGAVYNSPLGHNRNSIYAYNRLPDVIFEDVGFPNQFSKQYWIGADGKNFLASDNIAWFYSSTLLEPDMGWGKGQWKTAGGNSFVLEKGKTYVYYRSNLERCGIALPSIYINQPYSDHATSWRKAIQDIDGLWIDAGTETDMHLDAGSFLQYVHNATNNISYSKLTYNGNFLPAVSGAYVTLSAADPAIGYSNITISNPSPDFLIKIDLTNSRPYWGTSSYNLQNGLQNWGTDNERIVYDNLRIAQPNPTQVSLETNDVLTFRKSSCADCLVWNQPLQFTVLQTTRRWNEIAIDDCTKSEILNYLHGKGDNSCKLPLPSCYSGCQESICGCDNLCYSTKTGVTATFIPSDITFNTELSGIPQYVNYYARSPYTLNISVNNITNGLPPSGGLYVPPVSGIFATAQLPWQNIINDEFPMVAARQGGNYFSRKDLGVFTPDRLASGKYELKNGKYVLDTMTRNVSSLDIFSTNVGKVVSTDADWMKKNCNIPLVNGQQTFYPYTTNTELKENLNLGLWDSQQVFVPWNADGEWQFNDTFPKNYRGLYPLGEWYDDQLDLSGNVKQWQTDIFGNQYFLMFDDATNRLQRPSSYAEFFVKTSDGNIQSANVVLSSIFNKYSNLVFGTSSEQITGTFITTEDNTHLTTEDESSIILE